MVKPAFLLFPHQLFANIEPLRHTHVYLVETPLFFTQYPFHVQKLILHRASMKAYADTLEAARITVTYVEVDAVNELLTTLTQARCYDVADFDLLRSLQAQIAMLEILPSPNFYYSDNDQLFMHHFYIHQRKKLGILTDGKTPEGGQWSFDAQNRKKLPKNILLSPWQTHLNDYVEEARRYAKRFSSVGEAAPFYYPTTHTEAQAVLDYFLRNHFTDFGDFQDAMIPEDYPLYHSLISASLNIGLLDPKAVIAKALEADVPLNAKEGFIRQIIGWREFMRHTYDTIGVKQRTSNYFHLDAPIPTKVLEGKSGLLPVDDVMKKVHHRGYAHHIERLMILGNFFLLTGRDPNAVYTFFMTYFIDAYDWVMVGNVYGMSQYADGGLMTTKPYVSGSNYLLKMSHYSKGAWCEIWDALYWNFMHRFESRFRQNPRMHFALQGLKRMSEATLKKHLDRANAYLEWLKT
jgi:deoxyribodipyrimidine photolyase-related protein